jgi:hypothetical protein
MLTVKRILLISSMMALPVFPIACSGAEDTGDAAEPGSSVEESAIVLGEGASIRLPNDSTLRGVAVMVRRSDGTQDYALFRGPSKLADIITDGTFEFSEDSLPARVRVLQPGEELLRRQ